MIDKAFLPLDITPLCAAQTGPGFDGSVSMGDVGELRVARVKASPMAALRSRRHVDASGEDDYLLALHVRGIARAAQDGRSVALEAGDLALFDSSRPYVIEFYGAGSFEHVIYRVPRRALDSRCCSLAGATAVRVPITAAEGKLAAPYLNTLATLAPPRTRSAEQFAVTAIDLLVAALLAATGGVCAEPETSARSVLALIRQRAVARIADHDLSPASVAAASFISVRQLHRLFASQGTSFGTFVREERLRRCRRDLADPRLTQQTIGEIAARWGCPSAAHFTRIFTARYGITPRDFRQSTKVGAPPADRKDAERGPVRLGERVELSRSAVMA